MDGLSGRLSVGASVAVGERAAGSMRLVRLVDLNGPHETKALAGNGPDQALLTPAVLDRASNRIDPGCQCRVRDDASIPDACDKVVLADHPLAILDQEQQKVEDLRRQRHKMAYAPQLALGYIELVTLQSDRAMPSRWWTAR